MAVFRFILMAVCLFVLVLSPVYAQEDGRKSLFNSSENRGGQKDKGSLFNKGGDSAKPLFLNRGDDPRNSRKSSSSRSNRQTPFSYSGVKPKSPASSGSKFANAAANIRQEGAMRSSQLASEQRARTDALRARARNVAAQKRAERARIEEKRSSRGGKISRRGVDNSNKKLVYEEKKQKKRRKNSPIRLFNFK